jgi:hypothetical protein
MIRIIPSREFSCFPRGLDVFYNSDQKKDGMKVYWLLILLIWAGTAAAVPFESQTAKAFLDTLCCDAFGGRKSGDPEAHQAELWVAGKFAEFGLQPGGTDGYLQPFPILNNRELEASLELRNGVHGRKRYQHGEDFHLITNSGSGAVEAEVVFVGYGICEPERSRDDFAGQDLQGKIALIYKAVPGSERDWEEQLTRDYKLKKAVEHGAAAVIFVSDREAISGAAIHRDAFHPQVPVLLVSEHVVDDLFRGTGFKFATLKDRLPQSPQSFATGKIARVRTRLRYDANAVASNVIGILPGADAALRDEWIVVGGHLDHNGINAAGDIFRGADDNASGASVVLELARGFAALKVKPKRSLLFIEFAAEEQGLLGSEYFVAHPTVPRERIAAMFNFDCCGIGTGPVGFGGAEHFPEIWDAYQAGRSAEETANLRLSTIWRNGSDNHSFETAGIATFNYWSSGERSFYHQIEDLPEAISPTVLGNVGREAAEFIAFLADRDHPLLKAQMIARNRLFSAITLDPAPLRVQDAGSAEELRRRRQRGLDCQAVAVSADSPYADIESWRHFCAENRFRFAQGSGDVKAAVRNQQLALLPVLVEPERLSREAWQNLRDLGVKAVSLSDSESDSATRSNVVQAVRDLDLLVVCSRATAGQLPDDVRCAIVCDGDDFDAALSEAQDRKNRRVWVPFGSRAAEPCRAMTADVREAAVRTLFIGAAWDGASEQAGLLDFIEELEEAGFSGTQIEYLWGENLLEILPE